MSETESETETGESGDEHERHNSKMAKKKAARDKIMATKTNEKPKPALAQAFGSELAFMP